ncbi:MAG TPA: FAD:protein FMN transferase, partial [Bacteroidales bacterium]|nr:FAD:protein FMN transferase [Bacteroidales bacterium]
DILLPGVDDELADSLFLNIRNELERLESILSIYKDDSIFSSLNKKAASMPYNVDQEVFSLMSRMLKYNTLTLGYFDITLGTGLEQDASFPGHPAANRGILLDHETMSVSFSSSDVRIDSGAFGKGLALNSIKKILLQSKVSNAFISFGESSVLALGHHPYGDCWKVGIKDVFRPDTNVFVFDVNDGSVSTSGNSPNNELRYSDGHIVNPRGGETVKGYQLMSVAGPDPLDAEVLSTALILAEKSEQTTILGNFSGYRAVKISYPRKYAEAALEEL